MTALPVNEVFDTIQGEATHTGTPATFVRLQGCGVGCPWCDTKHTWRQDAADETTLEAVLAKTADSPAWAAVGAGDLVNLLARREPAAVVVTGGEPCQFDLAYLTTALLTEKRLVQVETSGTERVRVHPGAWVTLSPKVGMPGGRVVRQDAADRADEIKWPVGKPEDVARLQAFLAEFKVRPGVPVWLQPLSRSPRATELCIESAKRHGWRVSVQVHQFLGLR